MKIATKLLGAAALVSLCAPAMADAPDKLYINQLREKIGAVKADPNVAKYGVAEIEKAEAQLVEVKDNLDDDEVGQVESLTGEIDALLKTAKVRADIAATKAEIEQLKLSGSSRVANAEAEANQARAEAAQLRAALKDYQMRQTTLGATLVLQDVVFETGKADLKPGAAQRLQPLVNYLQANGEVKVRIDGHTDSVGAADYNQGLSQRRAEAVRSALSSAGIDASRIEAVGHGEAEPVASNANAAGRQQNRRVEITLVGQQANQLSAASTAN
jgi:outer membrane protein OmpA-like peptidoglycan-associated protein